MDSTFLQLDACWVPTETSWRQLRGLIRWSLVIWTTWSTFLIDDLIYLIRWSLVLSLRSTSPACLFNRNLDCLAFIAVLDHFLCRRRGSEHSLNLEMIFLDQIIFFEKFGRHMVTSFRSEGMARFGPNAYRWVFFGCVCKHACMHLRSVQMRLIFNSLTGKEQEPPS